MDIPASIVGCNLCVSSLDTQGDLAVNECDGCEIEMRSGELKLEANQSDKEDSSNK